MKPGKLFTIGCLMAVAAIGADNHTASSECVTVYLYGVNEIPLKDLQTAKLTAGRIFGGIGVSIQWREFSSPRAEETCVTVEMQFRSRAPEALHRGALAYAFPYRDGGKRIHIFADRVWRCSQVGHEGAPLGHVIAHELGHVLEQISRHSSEGVMKSRWVEKDFQQMLARPLHFASEDADLIRAGFLKRRGMASQDTR